ncbi:MAG: four helix bundle protein [Chloroflexi bacterium]|nr:four helix bundle protein [Chloroflexota bacterium]
MGGLNYAESFRDLLVYQKARELQQEVFLISSAFPKEERFSLSDQIRRSAKLASNAWSVLPPMAIKPFTAVRTVFHLPFTVYRLLFTVY